ncbi:protein-export chaperone SecB [Staphylococcus agnetis]|uniref:protein-export chaperone SecB n=1 Tax=Staphylococcus agnetis TaxID=985762 RepID=UPI0021D21326|nr:protein-export chaperone SecB [Staphylococcus agnetis]UXU54236.1 protein-export chaperone SecB [Staphylococcus agnetis]
MQSMMKFESFRILEIEYKFAEEMEEDNLTFEVKTSNIEINNVNKNHDLLIKMEMEDKNNDKLYNRKIVVALQGKFSFENNESIDIKTLESLLRINGTAILMPYIRTLVSNLTAFDNSTDHILLPTINVNSLLEDSEKEN